MTYRPRPAPADTTFDFSSGKVRILSLVALIGYPVAAVLDIYGPDLAEPARALGTFLRVVSMVAMFLVAGSSLAQLVAARRQPKLDEFQLRVRHSAIARAYVALSVLTGLAAIYIYVALDVGLPLPERRDTWQHLCFYVVLVIVVLPILHLAWSPDAALIEAEDE